MKYTQTHFESQLVLALKNSNIEAENQIENNAMKMAGFLYSLAVKTNSMNEGRNAWYVL